MSPKPKRAKPTTKPKKLPESFKRTYNTPPGFWDYDTHDIEMMNDVYSIDTETADVIKTTHITDVFYKHKSETKWEYGYSIKRVNSNKKYPCIGGPLDGAHAIRVTKGYVAYNCADNYRKRTYPTNVLIFKDLIIV